MTRVHLTRAKPPSRAALTKAAQTLRRLLAAVDTGSIGTPNTVEVALVRRVETILREWESNGPYGLR